MARCCFAGCLLASLAQPAVGQGGVTGGAREILSIGFANGVPKELPLTSGLVVVEKDGVRMLRASAESEVRVRLPEELPEKFTLEFDLISKEKGPSNDLSFRGTPNASDAFAEVNWSPTYHSVVGGALAGSNTFTMTTEKLGETVAGQLAKILASFEGDQLKLYTNGLRLYTVTRRFARSRVLRVSLGGSEENAVYLARLRVAAGAASVQVVTATALPAQQTGTITPLVPPPPPPASLDPAISSGRRTVTAANPSGTPGAVTSTRQTVTSGQTATNQSGITGTGTESAASVTGIVAQVDGQGKTTVSWQPVQGATSYVVVRWLVGDNVCCGNSSPLEGISALIWQDAVLPKGGTYGYRVYATTANTIYSGETTVVYQPSAVISTASSVVMPQTENALAPITLAPPLPRTISLSGMTAKGGEGSVTPRTIALGMITGSGGFKTPTSRTIALQEVAAAGAAKSVKTVTASTAPASRTIALSGVTASAGFGSLAARIIPLAGLTASGGLGAAPPPRTISLGGWTAAGAAKTSTKTTKNP